MPLLPPDECEIRTIEVKTLGGVVSRKTAFCYGSFGAVQNGKHWIIVKLDGGLSVFGAYFHNIEDACNAMFDLGNIAVYDGMTKEEFIVLIGILLKHNTCLDNLSREFDNTSMAAELRKEGS